MPISQQSVDFLIQNHMRNNKSWFAENRHLYTSLVEGPLLALAEELLPTVLDIDPFITVQPRRCLSRIWLDMRINRSGFYFRDHMWLVFRRGKGMVYPSFYFEYGPQGYGYGVGYYSMPPAVLNTVRQWVLCDDPRYLAAQKALDNLPGFQLNGPAYKRPKYPDAPSQKQDWLNRKSLSVTRKGHDAATLFSSALGQVLADVFQKLSPVYQLLLQAHLQSEG